MAAIAWAVGAIAAVVAIELSLRSVGLGNPLLYVADSQIGYLLAPNQTLRRFGKCIQINSFSMRSPEIASTRSPDTLRVLLLGDSIANGGTWTDQADIISERLRRSLAGAHGAIEVLNASASSWSPRNELAYLRRFGCFEAQIVILLLNTDDLFGAAPSSAVVGRDRHYLDCKPPFAIAELLSRYWFESNLKQSKESGDIVGINLQAIEQIVAIAQVEAKFILAMTPLLRELEAGSRDYELKARQRLQELTAQVQIPYLDFLEIFQAVPQPKTLYYDRIHLSSAGNQIVSDFFRQAIAK